jgi:hypothetical protein
MCARKSRSGAVARPNHGNVRTGSDDGASSTATIGLIATLLAALIAATATVAVALINHEPNHTPADLSPPVVAMPGAANMPQPTCPTCTPGGKTFTEQVHTSNPAGTTTFHDPRGFRGEGPRVLLGQRVEVVCRFLDPNAPASVQPGWWYLVDSPPWNRQYYTPANTYLNGDPPEGPHGTAVDGRVPVC